MNSQTDRASSAGIILGPVQIYGPRYWEENVASETREYLEMGKRVAADLTRIQTDLLFVHNYFGCAKLQHLDN